MTETIEGTLPSGLPPNLPPGLAVLMRAAQARSSGRLDAAIAIIEAELSELRAAPNGASLQARVQLALALADTHLAAGNPERARNLLLAETAEAERLLRQVTAGGTPEHRRTISAGRLQLRDRLTQLALLGEPAPEIDVADWIQGEPTTLAGLRGRVVLLEFWATWCRPCIEAFPRLHELHARHAAEGLTVLALTRYGPPVDDPTASRAHERDLVRTVVADRGLNFLVGIAPDEQLQRRYGASGVPTMVLIDRQGIVRLITSAGDEATLDTALATYLGERYQ
ncbi:MAG: TlpA family protein disulfide reductase [Chloroflexi bacterium]|nr:TlpA family protein disulfide reductase [Chloroflexota bacterium]